jgi:hypothetical protein
MIYVYAVAEELRDIADLTGVQRERLVGVPFGHATVVAGEVAARPPIEPAMLRGQDALVRALHDRAGALLPMRFGTTSGDREEMLRSLEAHADLLTRLAAVRGCEQMTARAFGASSQVNEPAPAGASGTEYLRARAQRQQPAPALDILARAAGDLAKDVRIETAGQPGVLGSVYHLIARGRASEYREAIERVARDLTPVRVLVTGPTPPYAFT